MKNHGDFMRELNGLDLNPIPHAKLIEMTRMGIAPEGKGGIARNRLADVIYSMPDSAFFLPPQQITPDPLTKSVAIPASSHNSSTAVVPVFHLSQKSLAKGHNVHPKLWECVLLAIKYSLVDFGVGEAERSIEKQAEYVRDGKSQTMHSKHLVNDKGIVRAVDLWAYVNGTVTWQFDYYYYIARAMDRAATELGIAEHIRWGCVWDRVLGDFGVQAGNLEDAGHVEDAKVATRRLYLLAIEDYKKRHAGSDFLDGPHFEWVD